MSLNKASLDILQIWPWKTPAQNWGYWHDTFLDHLGIIYKFSETKGYCSRFKAESMCSELL